jgi:dihydrolipoamide dehydrogenase
VRLGRGIDVRFESHMTDTANLHVGVLGAGPGGYAAAFLAADLGLKVTLIDREANPGGVCLYRGCIPSKALLHVAKLIEESRQASHWGISFGEPKIELDRLRSFKNDVIQKLTGGLGQLSRQRKVQYLRGEAAFENSNTLRLTKPDLSQESLRFDRIIIATGSRPSTIPALQLNSPRMMDSTGGLDLKDVPSTLLVIGGGYIGLELGTVYAALGAKVTVVEMTGGLLPGADRDLVQPLQKRLETQLASIFLNTTVTALAEEPDGIRVSFESAEKEKREQVFDRVLVSVGRRPNSNIAGLEKTRVQVGPGGFVQVDNRLATADPSIFAVGDVVGEPMLAHKASHEGRVAAEVIAGHKAVFEPSAIPAVVFTDPEIAWCGLTETQARKQNREIKVAKFPWAASGRAMTLDRTEGMTKLIVDPQSERVLGMGVVGSGAGELIAEGVLAIEMAALAKDIALTIHPHPTLSETVMESAEVFFGTSTDLYRPKR